MLRLQSEGSQASQHSQGAKQVQTEEMGDIHHYAWRARFRNQTVYINKRDSERFGEWASQQCSVSCAARCHAAF